jgi:hypothetical protein
MPMPPLLPLPPDLEPIADWLATADPQALRDAIVRLITRVRALERERSALKFAAESFEVRAARLNSALRELRDAPLS